MDTAGSFEALGIALGLGLLVGLQRERADSRIGGLRTFALITVLGALSAILARVINESAGAGPGPPAPAWGGPGWFVVAVALLGVVVSTAVAAARSRATEPAADPGGETQTAEPAAERAVTRIHTEIATLVMFMVGVLVVVGPKAVAIAVGGGVAVLLQAKAILHGFARQLGEKDLKAIMQFALISLVVLPVLPDRAYGPFEVLNPQQIWLMVVLIVGISLGGYIAYRFLGPSSGVVLVGLLGGLVSSTATTASFARRDGQGADAAPGRTASAVLVVMLAGTVMYLRVLTEVAAVAPRQFVVIAEPIAVLFVLSIALSLLAWMRARRLRSELPQRENPTELRSALFFGTLYAAVLFASAAAKHRFGDAGMLAVASLSGLTDMDAITLSSARMVVDARLDTGTAWRAIVLAIMSSMVFKTAIVAALGSRQMLWRIAALMGVCFLAGAGVLWLWPA